MVAGVDRAPANPRGNGAGVQFRQEWGRWRMTVETGVEANKAMVETYFQTIWNEGRYDEETPSWTGMSWSTRPRCWGSRTASKGR
jgi:hypothetical protein